MRLLLGTVGWGVSIYSVMYLVWAVLLTYGLETGYGALIVRLAILVVLTAVAINSVRLTTRGDLLLYAGSWAIMAVVLDALLLVPLYGTALYLDYGVWVGYAVIAITPFCVFEVKRLFRRIQPL